MQSIQKVLGLLATLYDFWQLGDSYPQHTQNCWVSKTFMQNAAAGFCSILISEFRCMSVDMSWKEMTMDGNRLHSPCVKKEYQLLTFITTSWICISVTKQRLIGCDLQWRKWAWQVSQPRSTCNTLHSNSGIMSFRQSRGHGGIATPGNTSE
jgi:hypothetical protein